jgi:probable F420-dependent oxidoreductase
VPDARERLSANGVTMGFVAPPDRGAVRALEAAGAASLWVGGHVSSPYSSPEVIVALAALVERTDRVLVGTSVLLLPLYPPALVAKQLADLDRASGGRVIVGVGVGGEQESDFRACGVPMAERGSRTNEALPLLRQFWRAEPVTHKGQHFHFDDVRIHPAPAQPGGPPLIVSGRQAPAMRRAALLGDGWMPYLYSSRRYRESVEQIRAIAKDAGRDLSSFQWIAYLVVSMADDPAVARRAALVQLGQAYNQDFDAMLDRVAVVGTRDEVQAKLQGYVDAGARHLVVGLVGTESAEQLLGDVLPGLRHIATSED